MKKICYFGIFDPSYNRNKNLIRGFEENGWEVTVCRVDPRAVPGIRKYVALFREAKKIRKDECAFVVVGFPGQTVLWLAVLLFGRRKVVFDAFISIYNANVYDRGKYGPFHPRALWDWFSDWCSMRLAPVVLAHTKTEGEFFARRFGVSREKIVTVYIGAPDEHAAAAPENTNRPIGTVVHFHGGFTKIQGLPCLVDAAHLLRDEPVSFQILGNGVEGPVIRQKIKEYGLEEKVALPGRVPFEEYIAQAHVCIGILGDTRNTDMMVPNKVFEYMAFRKAIITADTPASREVFTDGIDALLCRKNDPESVANSIRVLMDTSRRQKLQENARALYLKRFTPKVLVAGLLEELRGMHMVP